MGVFCCCCFVLFFIHNFCLLLFTKLNYLIYLFTFLVNIPALVTQTFNTPTSPSPFTFDLENNRNMYTLLYFYILYTVLCSTRFIQKKIKRVALCEENKALTAALPSILSLRGPTSSRMRNNNNNNNEL